MCFLEVKTHNSSGCHVVDFFELRVNCAMVEVYAKYNESAERDNLTELEMKDKTALKCHLLDEEK